MAKTEQELIRLEKLNKLKVRGNPYPNDVKVTFKALDVLAKEPNESKNFTLAGRIVQQRLMGKAAFFHILDSSAKIQVYVRQEDLGLEAYEQFKDLDLGDIVEVTGFLFLTKTQEKTIHAKAVRLLTKCLHTPPEKWHGLTDIEARYRHRYVDLFSNPEIREVFKTRSKIIRLIREFLDARGYVEVETPVLQKVAGGTIARPFNTHFNALHEDMSLRIALEIPLKKLIVGGLEKVYEIGRVFRNEGLSKKHNPEFTMLEFYEAYADYESMMNLTEELFSMLANKVAGSKELVFGEQNINFSTPWLRLSMQESIHKLGGVPKEIDLSKLENIHKVASNSKIELHDSADWGRSLEALFDYLVEDKLINPTFITHHPFSISPLARRNDQNPLITDRFELYIAGMEVANAFSELNDPIDQRARFEDQAKRKAAGDQTMPDIDEDFLLALEYGMPPTGGEGIGIDRLVMLFTNSHTIKEVLLFPQLKSE